MTGGNLIGYYINSAQQTIRQTNTELLELNTSNLLPQHQYIPGTTVRQLELETRTNHRYQLPTRNNVVKTSCYKHVREPIDQHHRPLRQVVTASLSINRVDSGVVLMTAVGASYFNIGYQIDAAYSATTGEQLWIANRTLTPFTRDSITKVWLRTVLLYAISHRA